MSHQPDGARGPALGSVLGLSEFDLVSDAGAPASPPRSLETRDKIMASFADCPGYLSKSAEKLARSSGQWA